MENRSVVLGPGILGQEAFDAQQVALSREAGPIGLGPGLGTPFVPNAQIAKKAATPIDAPPPPPAPKLVQSGAPSVPPKKARTPRASAPARPGFSEEQAIKLLRDDPNKWQVIVDEEKDRAEGPRAAVAQVVIEIAPLATEHPVPELVLEALQAVVDAVVPDLAE